MADKLVTIRTSRGLKSILKGDVLNDFFREALKEDIQPFVEDHYNEHVENWDDKPTFKIVPRVGETGQTFSIKVGGSNLARSRWLMVDKKGRRGGKKIVSKKTKTVPVKEQKAIRGSGGKALSRVVKTKTVRVPMPMRQYNSKTVKYGARAFGDGDFEEPSDFRLEVIQGKVEPLRISENFKDDLEAEIKRALTLAYNRGYNKLIRQR